MSRPAAWLRWLAVAVSVGLVLRATQGGDFSIPPMRIPAAWCLVCGPGWLMDGTSNVVLFLPLGASLAWAGRPLRQATGWSALLSLAVELLQAAGIPPLRSPSLADLVANSVGGWLGAALIVFGPVLRAPAPSVGARLAAGWMAGVLAILAATTLALQPDATGTPAGAGAPVDRVATSPYEYAPGYGWYGGVPSALRINGVSLPSRGEGPAVVQSGIWPDTLVVALTLRGRDTLPYQRAVLFVHTPGDTVPLALLTQHGTDLRWQQRGLGYRWGLAKPQLRLPSVLPPRAMSDTAPLEIRAVASRERLLLAAHRGHVPMAREVSARLTPGIGWALLQGVVSLSDREAPLVRLAWFAVLLAPLAYWSRRCGVGWVLGSAALTSGGVLAMARLGHLAIPDAAEWLTWGLAFALGLLLPPARRPESAPGYIS